MTGIKGGERWSMKCQNQTADVAAHCWYQSAAAVSYVSPHTGGVLAHTDTSGNNAALFHTVIFRKATILPQFHSKLPHLCSNNLTTKTVCAVVAVVSTDA